MSERGVFAVDRGIFDHPSFAPEPFTQREAWQWLIAEAAWKPNRRRVGTVSVDLNRGQVAHSLRFMAAKWKWSEPRVRRFLTRLKTDAMIDAATDACITVLTICNYDRYQRVSLPTDAATDARSDAAPTQHRRKEEGIKEEPKKEDSEPRGSGADAPRDVRKDLFGRGRETLERITGKTPDSCRRLLGQWLKSVNDEAIHILGAIDDAAQNRVADPVAWITKTLQPRVQNGQGRPRTVQQAAQDQLERFRAINEPAPSFQLQPGIRDGTGPADVRLLPPRRRE